MDTLLALTQIDAPKGRRGLAAKVTALRTRLADEGTVPQPVSFAALATRAESLVGMRNVVAHWTITRLEQTSDGVVLTYVNPEKFPLTERADFSGGKLDELANSIAVLAEDLRVYVHLHHAALRQMMNASSLIDGGAWNGR